MPRPRSESPVIDRYKAATCIPFLSNPKVVALSDGMRVLIRGERAPGGRIVVRYLKNDEEVVAVRPGDYIYPVDVRLDSLHDHLYVRASGLAAGIWQQTWLFQYDLRSKRLIAKEQVVDDVLPIECWE